MNEIDLNDLAIKTDSLPDSWKMLLIDPTTGLPAKNMTVARFIELFTNKQPVVSENSNGLFSIKLFRQFSGIAPYFPEGDANTILNNLALLGGKNRPIDDDFHYFIQIFYGEISSTRNRIQIALGYKTGLIHTRVCINKTFSDWKRFTAASNYSLVSNALTDTISDNYSILPPPANCVPNYSESDGSVEQFAVSAMSETASQDGSIPVRSESEVQEQYVWSIDKIGRAVLELQEENKRLKQILNIDDSEVQQM